MRLAHWLLALSVIVLIATGWLVKLAPGVANAASEYHRLAGVGLILGLMLRVWLLLAGTGPARWKALVPQRDDLPRMGMTLVFYATMGKSPQPKWYAHNPLWAPLYLLVLMVLVVQALTGLLMESYPVVGTFYLPSVHDFWAWFVLVFACLHILAVALHDAKGTASDVSAMLNGHRIFVVEEADPLQAPGVHTVSLDQLKKPRKTS